MNTPPHADQTHLWYRPGTPKATFREDYMACRREAESQRSSLAKYGGMIGMMSEKNRLEKIFFECMTAKGYFLTNTTGLTPRP